MALGLVLTGNHIKKMWHGRNDSKERKKFIERILLTRLAKVDEVIKTVILLCLEDANYITGVAVDINGGMFFV